MMKIYLLCKRYYTNKDLILDHFGRLYHLPVQLASQGAHVTVGAIDYRHHDMLTQQDADVTFHTIPATLRKAPLLLSNINRQARMAQPDIMIASGDIYIGYIGYQMARRLKARFIYDVYDYYPAFPINRIPFMTTLFNYVVTKAEIILCASEPLQRKIKTELNQKVILIENGVDTNIFRHGNREEARKKLNLPLNIPLIGYFGSITPTRGPLLIDACKILKTRIPNLRLILAGRVKGISLDAPYIDYLGELHQETIPALIQACDVVTIPYLNDTFNQMCGACKIAEYLACGTPAVATRVSDHAHIFRQSPASLCDFTPEDMARAIQAQLDAPEIVPFPDNLDWQTIGRMLYQTLEKKPVNF